MCIKEQNEKLLVTVCECYRPTGREWRSLQDINTIFCTNCTQDLSRIIYDENKITMIYYSLFISCEEAELSNRFGCQQFVHRTKTFVGYNDFTVSLF